MTTASAAKLSRQEQLAEIIGTRTKVSAAATEQVTTEARFAEISANPFFKILFDEARAATR